MRSSGILMPIFSLSGKYGIGTLGKSAYEFIDFLEKAGQSYWQILPLNPTNYGDSPYQSFSAYAGNPYFIDLTFLEKKGLLLKGEAESFDFGSDHTQIDYGKLYENRSKILDLAFSRFEPNEEYNTFCSENGFWLNNYALFMALKDSFGGKSWLEWDENLRLKDKAAIKKAQEQYKKKIEFYCFVQFEFFTQWSCLKAYANQKGIKIIGDIPIYVALDSADVWASPEAFLLDEKLCPTLVAGVPPDVFSKDGQLWGNPLYDWEFMKKDGYTWWKNRLGYVLKLYDTVRIDHFRGFEAFYAIPYGDKTAKNGHWIKGPDFKFFEEVKNWFGKDVPIIAEDLGFLTPQVEKMLKKSGFPGMKVLQFAFDDGANSNYMPHNHTKNSVVYTGTHDNNTVLGWAESATPESLELANRYMHVDPKEGINWAMMRTALMSVADTAILMMADLLGLGSEARINTPSTLGENWKWRIEGGCINDWLAGIVYENTALYGRLPKKKQKILNK